MEQSAHPTEAELAQALTAISGQPYQAQDVLGLADAAHKDDIADATLKYRVKMPSGDSGFLLVSGAGNSALIARAVANITRVRAAVSLSSAAPILPPVLQGQVAERSFAMWPVREPFMAGGRIQRVWRRYRYANAICVWQRTLVQETQHPAQGETFRGNLQAILKEPAFVGDMHRAATQALGRVNAGDWTPVHCCQHGDFWIGNILLPHPREDTPFHVIDWAGMNPSGYPFMDLCRILASLRCPHWFAVRQIAALRTQIGCAPEDITGFVLSGLGHTSRNLEYFPPDRFRAKAQNIFRYISQL